MHCHALVRLLAYAALTVCPLISLPLRSVMVQIYCTGVVWTLTKGCGSLDPKRDFPACYFAYLGSPATVGVGLPLVWERGAFDAGGGDVETKGVVQKARDGQSRGICIVGSTSAS